MSSCYRIGAYSECTCGANQYGQWHYQEFYNYCPLCGHYDCLGLYYMNDGDVEIHCYHCGADYCAYDGWDKSGSYRAKLSVYVEPKEEPNVQTNKTEKVVVEKSKLEVMNDTFQYNRHVTKLVSYI